jgi:hypothetical protein
MQTNSCDQTTLRDLEKITTLRNKHIQTNNDEWTKKRNNGNFFLNEKKKKPSSKCGDHHDRVWCCNVKIMIWKEL